MLEKIRVDQPEQSTSPPIEIHGLRKPDGTLAREHAVRLNQLPGKEGELSKSHDRARRRPPRARRHDLRRGQPRKSPTR